MTQKPLTDAEAEAACRLIAEGLDDAGPVATSYRDVSPVPLVGTAPPVAQPGRPPMSQRATDASTLMLCTGASSVLVSGAVSLVLYTAGHQDPTTVGMVCTTPVAVLGALSLVLKRAKAAAEAAPPVIHQHYDGAHVEQDHSTYTTEARGLIARAEVHRGESPEGK